MGNLSSNSSYNTWFSFSHTTPTAEYLDGIKRVLNGQNKDGLKYNDILDNVLLKIAKHCEGTSTEKQDKAIETLKEYIKNYRKKYEYNFQTLRSEYEKNKKIPGYLSFTKGWKSLLGKILSEVRKHDQTAGSFVDNTGNAVSSHDSKPQILHVANQVATQVEKNESVTDVEEEVVHTGDEYDMLQAHLPDGRWVNGYHHGATEFWNGTDVVSPHDIPKAVYQGTV